MVGAFIHCGASMMALKSSLTRILINLTNCTTVRRFYCLLVLLAMLTARLSASDASSVTLNRDGIILHSPQTEIIYEGMASYGNYRLFGAAENAKLYTAGVEYDRELWPRFLRARVDYVSEILPVLLLSQPVKTDFWGNTLSSNRKVVPGIGITPLGFRLLWRDGRRWMPYFETKGSVLGFTQKALSSDATYENWSFHLTGGIKLKLRGRYDLRLGVLSDMHFSNAFVVRSNPALDVMNANVGIVYHFGGRSASL
jgi:Lipid A 3-O-deacylase (PagL)